MGLDTVELVMDVEETFEVKISDEAAQRIVTVGELFECVVNQLELAVAGKCLSAATFYEIRSSFQKVGIEERFGPSTRLSEVLPMRKRRSRWTELAEMSKLKLPALRRPLWVVVLNTLATVAASVYCYVSMGIEEPWLVSMSESVLALNFSEIMSKHGAMGRNDVWVVLRSLIVDNLGVEVDEVVPEADFVKDLGCC